MCVSALTLSLLSDLFVEQRMVCVLTIEYSAPRDGGGILLLCARAHFGGELEGEKRTLTTGAQKVSILPPVHVCSCAPFVAVYL